MLENFYKILHQNFGQNAKLNHKIIARIDKSKDTDHTSPPVALFLFDLILYVPSTIFQLNRDGSSWVEPVLS